MNMVKEPCLYDTWDNLDHHVISMLLYMRYEMYENT